MSQISESKEPTPPFSWSKAIVALFLLRFASYNSQNQKLKAKNIIGPERTFIVQAWVQWSFSVFESKTKKKQLLVQTYQDTSSGVFPILSTLFTSKECCSRFQSIRERPKSSGASGKCKATWQTWLNRKANTLSIPFAAARCPACHHHALNNETKQSCTNESKQIQSEFCHTVRRSSFWYEQSIPFSTNILIASTSPLQRCKQRSK